MTNYITYFTILICCSLSFSQDCSKFYPLSEGTNFEITNYESNGKVAAKTAYSVTDVNRSNGTEIATINTVIRDKKDKIITETSFEMNCNGDVTSIDFKSLMNSQMLDQFKNMETDISGENLILPNDLSVGQQLPDAKLDISISLSGINMRIATYIRDRKVIAQESVTTPAGTFNCYVISYVIDLDSMGMNRTSTSKQWVSEGVGMVKQEDYNNNGKTTSSSLLTTFNR
ncbi:TapB family protein [Ulvibacter antarcticus]|uniref:DUF3108 domain-containing protein n=1 Tax=Ulvibacter antarcticus TaxID=442714 RepID=A0A3L9YRS6_9FLAO|nr:hypothetical protein [Ulvibacter antarcticus]RMA57172.1 hypothetical protein BXY75_3059 [Ulvibacter antarcticus]